MVGTPSDDETVVKRGTFLYGGEVTCDVRIVRRPFRPGTGDLEDSPEVALDQPGAWFEVQFGSTTERGRFSSGAGGGSSLEDAMEIVERSVDGVTWLP